VIILFDQDGPLANETARLFEVFKERFPKDAAIHSGVRTHFKLTDNFPPHLHGAIEDIRREKGFYLSFPPVEGSVEAFRVMLSRGHEVFICTSFMAAATRSPYCISEKFEWVERHMGSEFVGRILVVRDKTAVRGDILIDDKPTVSGRLQPMWEHIIFDAPYNRQIKNRRRLTWQNWRTALPL